MCGILAVASDNAKYIDATTVELSLDTIVHRGPDAKQWQTVNNVILGHRRLSILDLDVRSNQPMRLDGYIIVFNGEIFNFIEIRAELESLGHRFSTEGDTEVVLISYIEWGTEAFDRFNGMWSLVIYDEKANQLIACRDRFGIKPLYYYVADNAIYFCSEIKQLFPFRDFVKKINYRAISNFLQYSSGAEQSETWFEGVYRMKPNTFVAVDCTNYKMDFGEYGYLPTNLPNGDNLDSFKWLLDEAVKLRLRSDVPLGFTLSSGIDSSTLVSLAHNSGLTNFHTYTAQFNPLDFSHSEKSSFTKDIEIDEISLVRKFAESRGFKSNAVNIDYSNYITELSSIIYHLESGNSSPAIFPIDQIYRRASRDVKVLIEGQGADELLAGYISTIFFDFLLALFLQGKILRLLKELYHMTQTYSLIHMAKMFLRTRNNLVYTKIYLRTSGVKKVLKNKLTKKRPYPYNKSLLNHSDYLQKKLGVQHANGLINLLHYGDSLSMKYSIESRMPFMDVHLIMFCKKLTVDDLVQDGRGKHILRQTAKSILPDYLSQNPYKFGFDSPLKYLFTASENNDIRDIILSKSLSERGIVNANEIKKMLDNLDKRDNSRFLFRLLQTELWFRKFIDEEILV